MRVIDAFRKGMIHELQLDSWLRRLGLEYHFLGVTGFPTVSGYDRGRDHVVTGQEGDGTVPISSAVVQPASTEHLFSRTFVGGDHGHQNLCQRRDVQAYCLSVLRGRGPAARVAAGQDPEIEDFVAMARSILRKAPRSRGVVLSITRLASRDGASLIDTTTIEPSTSARKRLKNPPNHLSSPEIFTVWSPRHRRWVDYLWILSNEQATHPVGGMLFLPAEGSGARDLYFATFNVGNLDERNPARCRNAHHAEMQLVRWVDEQPVSRRARIGTIHMVNRSRSTRIRGYSPCNACCSDLARFLTLLKSVSGGRWITAKITWFERYTGAQICGHPTDEANLKRLAASGWQLDERTPPSPSPSRPRVLTASSGGRWGPSPGPPRVPT
jgi:hypothetical protein